MTQVVCASCYAEFDKQIPYREKRIFSCSPLRVGSLLVKDRMARGDETEFDKQIPYREKRIF